MQGENTLTLTWRISSSVSRGPRGGRVYGGESNLEPGKAGAGFRGGD